MSKPLTMTVEREREYRACCTSGGTEVDPVFAELDATRAALAAAEAKAATLREFRGVRSIQEFTAERDKALAALADERRHADALAGPSICDGSGKIIVTRGDLDTVEACGGCYECALVNHAARRAAEVAK